jgi:hypothetical protein
MHRGFTLALLLVAGSAALYGTPAKQAMQRSEITTSMMRALAP